MNLLIYDNAIALFFSEYYFQKHVKCVLAFLFFKTNFLKKIHQTRFFLKQKIIKTITKQALSFSPSDFSKMYGNQYMFFTIRFSKNV